MAIHIVKPQKGEGVSLQPIAKGPLADSGEPGPTPKPPKKDWADHLTDPTAPKKEAAPLVLSGGSTLAPAEIKAAPGVPLKTVQVEAQTVVEYTKYIKETGKTVQTKPPKQIDHSFLLTIAPIPNDRLAHVSVGAKRTVNLGNYESAQVHVGLSFPSDVKNINETYKFISDWVGDKMADALDEET